MFIVIPIFLIPLCSIAFRTHSYTLAVLPFNLHGDQVNLKQQNQVLLQYPAVTVVDRIAAPNAQENIFADSFLIR